MTGIIDAIVSPVVDNLFGERRLRAKDERERRRAAAKDLLQWLDPMADELRHLRWRRNPMRWHELIEGTYQSLDEGRPLVPPAWHHLKHSLRDCLGHGVGGGFALLDLIEVPENSEVDYHPEWSMYAGDYVDLCRRQVRLWGDTWGARQAQRNSIPTYDEWLRRSGLWPKPSQR